MPTTRSGNRTADPKAYYSKKAAPHQQHFPHRRKVVRRPDPQNSDGKKQMKFLPDMMRRRDTVQDSDDEGGESVEDEEVENVQQRRTGEKRNRRQAIKREEGSEEDRELSTLKRRRKHAPVDTPQRSTRQRRAAGPVAHGPEDGCSDEAEEEEAPKPRLRRQSTMTQIVDGRSPAPGSAEPDFKPLKRTPRTSWGGQSSRKGAKKDIKQRTLTQMVHNMTPLVLDSDEDAEGSETDEEADAAYHSFMFGNAEEAGSEQFVPAENAEKEALPTVEASVQVAEDSDNSGDEYQPTQFIEAPAKGTRRTPLRSSTRLRDTSASKNPISTSPKARFGRLSTPEKRGVLEIASSQSPHETLLSTQNTPGTRRSGRTPLKSRSVNVLRMAETPSKRGAETPSKGKQVTFQEGSQEQIPPPTLKRFASTIPDSEDELEDLSESESQPDADYGDGEYTQALLRNADAPISGIDVGDETQTIFFDIDRACNNTLRSATGVVREESEELGEPINCYEAEISQELGSQHLPRSDSANIDGQSSEVAELPPLPFSSPKPRESAAANEGPSVGTQSPTTQPTVEQFPSSPPIDHFRTQSPTAMFADDETLEESEEVVTVAPPHPSTPIKQLRSSPVEDFKTQPTIPMFDSDDQPSEDLDDVSTATPAPPHQPDIQVFRSPPARLQPEPSHSSQAEQQLQSEYQTYSQYRRPMTFPSSMHVAHDSHYSYQATPRPLTRDCPTQLPPQTHSNHISQATTVDLTQISPKVTPQKPKVKKEPMFTRSAIRTPKRQRQDRSTTTTPRTQRHIRSATTTPKSSRTLGLSMSSPDASAPPPTLFIPSSFPSPARVTMEGWSSPVVGRDGVGESQWGVGSLEDFSIPAPPPGEWVEDEDEEL